MLGEGYAGLFPPNDLTALVQVLEKSAQDRDFYSQLKCQVTQRAPLFAFETEKQAWGVLIDSLLSE